MLPTEDSPRFEAAKREALSVLDELVAREREPENQALVNRYSSEHWQRERRPNQRYMRHELDESFRSSLALGRQMIAVTPRPSHIDRYVTYLMSGEDVFAQRMREGSLESRIGRPYLEYTDGTMVYSKNTIEHLYYIARLTRKTDRGLPRSMIELGGGFGNLARLVQLLSPKATYVDVDYPETLALVHFNLRLNLPDLPIVVHTSTADITPNAVNLLPLWLVPKLDFNPDVFLSTFALSETSHAMRDACFETAFFNSERTYIVGSDDTMFNGAPAIRANCARLYGSASVQESFRPAVYEVIGTREPSITESATDD